MTVVISPAMILATNLTPSNGAGPISALGVKVGDRVITSFLTTSGVGVGQGNPGTFVEYIVSVDDEIQQLDTSNLTGSPTRFIDVFLIREA